MADNPFVYQAPASQPPPTGNPFDPLGGAPTPPGPPPQANPFSPGGASYGGGSDNRSLADQSATAQSYNSQMYGAAQVPQMQPPQQMPPAPPMDQNPFGHQAPPYNARGYVSASPFAQQQNQAQPNPHVPPTTENSLVISQYQTNPYAQPAPTQPAPAHDNALVVSAYQSNQHAGYGQPAAVLQTPTSNPFDPFAAAPPPAPAAYPGYPLQQTAAPPTAPPAAAPPQQPGYPPEQPGYPPQQPAPPASTAEDLALFGGPPAQDAPSTTPSAAPIPSETPERPRYTPKAESTSPRDEHPAYANVQNMSANDDLPGGSPRNKYASELAREAPMGASPLPKAELVRKRGYVLARISFRTIVIKKWKQAFWVQYGPHTMLWFRSESDFDDWLNNPYHTQSQRNFLIKLAVNFVHDLYKPNVRGYQVTQCRTKPYGNKMVRQFKLERWMDYGPTIAAAFGSYNPKEVDELREALVECMRNTPLSGGIRATGAVRRPPTREESGESDAYADNGYNERAQRTESERRAVEVATNEAEDEPGEEADLLDVNNWDDVPTQPVTPHYDPTALAAAQSPYGANLGTPPAPQASGFVYPGHQQPYQQQIHQQYQQQPYQQQFQAPPAPGMYQHPQVSAPEQGVNPYAAQAPQDPWAAPQNPPTQQSQQYQMGY